MLNQLTRMVSVIALLLTAVAAQAPDPSNPNVYEHKIKKANRDELKVHKSHSVDLIEIWKKVDGAWVRTWSKDTGGPYNITGQDSDKTSVKLAGGGDFTKDDQYRFVIEPTDSNGNSTTITDVVEHNQ